MTDSLIEVKGCGPRAGDTSGNGVTLSAIADLLDLDFALCAIEPLVEVDAIAVRPIAFAPAHDECGDAWFPLFEDRATGDLYCIDDETPSAP